MGHPGSGKNDIPNRLKRNFFMFNLVLPSITSINDIYGQMLQGRFKDGGFDAEVMKAGSARRCIGSSHTTLMYGVGFGLGISRYLYLWSQIFRIEIISDIPVFFVVVWHPHAGR